MLNKKFYLRVSLFAIGMFGFAFLMAPLYSSFCQATGLDGRTSNEVFLQAPYEVDISRSMILEFDSNVIPALNFDFYPSMRSIKIHPGESYSLFYKVTNKMDRALTVQAIPSVTPAVGSKYIKKLECFCFQPQYLGAGENKYFPLRIAIDPAIPPYIKVLTLSYTLFEVNE